ncbi:FtsQ-type POTRA domain-containing protein [Chloroflexota bacterium]
MERPKNRIDEIRRRRQNKPRSTKSEKKTRNRSRDNRSSPPVMARAVVGSVPIHRKKVDKKQRRRYDVSLGRSGTEMRLPTLPQFRIGWRLISFVFVVVLVFGAYQFWDSPVFLVNEAEIVGLERISPSDVNSVLDVSGQSIFLLDPENMEQRLLESFAEFSTVSVQIDLPGTVLVTVSERSPVLVWNHEGRSEYVDVEGKAFPVRSEVQAAGPLPVIEADQDPPTYETSEQSQQTLASIDLELLNLGITNPEPSVSTARSLLAPEMVSAILMMHDQAPDGARLIFEEVHGLGWQDTHGWYVYFGDMNDINMKANIYNAILNQLQQEQEHIPAMISVEYLHAPYYTLE